MDDMRRESARQSRQVSRRGLRGIALVALLAVLNLLALAPVHAQQPGGSLVSAEWLQRNLGRADLLLLDAQPAPLHRKAHIPGAVSINLYAYAVREQSAADMQKLMRAWGIGADRTVVVYDQGGDMLAARLFFDLHMNGMPTDRLLLLDGGMRRWQAIGGAVTAEPTPAPVPGDIVVDDRRRRGEVFARLPEAFAASGNAATHALVDALEPEYYYGQTKFFGRAGHLPNATLMSRPDLYNADGTFRSAEELRQLADYYGIRPDQQIVTYCGGGVAAAVPWFALKFVAGYPRVSLYAGSEYDWLRDDRGLPFWSYAAPTLLRDAAWLDAWNAKMLRGFGLARISVVDVRPAAAYAQGHLPAAVSVPPERWAAQVRDPQGLAATLALAGINSGDEAVIVSAGGLDGDAALAFALLEHAGQRKVSLLLESVDEWGLRGLPLEKAAPAPSAATAPAVAATWRPEQPRDVIVTDPRAPGGAYPTVLLESGRTRAAASSAAIHVPYTDLLNADGTPKAAKDIWTILAKAGLPRHARVVTTADDPREAAINYTVLRLMGWPDVRVLVR